LPQTTKLPLYVVEVQFQRVETFYANLFAKVFCYLEENDPTQEWVAVAIFPSRKQEPKHLKPYEDLLQSHSVRRIFLNELPAHTNSPLGLELLQLMRASFGQAKKLAPHLLQRAKVELADSVLVRKVVELMEGLLMRRFTELTREEIRMKFQLHDIRESRVWKEAVEEGISLHKKEMVKKCLAKGMSVKQIANLMELPLDEVKQLAEEHSQ
jgi:predicted transposase/invertase (TIGR01784 family)